MLPLLLGMMAPLLGMMTLEKMGVKRWPKQKTKMMTRWLRSLRMGVELACFWGYQYTPTSSHCDWICKCDQISFLNTTPLKQELPTASGGAEGTNQLVLVDIGSSTITQTTTFEKNKKLWHCSLDVFEPSHQNFFDRCWPHTSTFWTISPTCWIFPFFRTCRPVGGVKQESTLQVWTRPHPVTKKAATPALLRCPLSNLSSRWSLHGQVQSAWVWVPTLWCCW